MTTLTIPTDQLTTFGGRLYWCRLLAGFRTQAALAKAAKFDPTYIHKWENAIEAPPEKHVKRLAKVVKVDPAWLATGEGPEGGPQC